MKSAGLSYVQLVNPSLYVISPLRSLPPYLPSRRRTLKQYPILLLICPLPHSFELLKSIEPAFMPTAFSARLRASIASLVTSKPNPSSFQAPTPAAFAYLRPRLYTNSTFTASPFTATSQFRTIIMNGANGATRSKRKQHPGTVAERPQKQQKALNGKESAGQNTPEIGTLIEDLLEGDDMDIEEPRVMASIADTAEWQAAIEKVVKNVVSIRFCQTCSFDTDAALTSEATGFVVDAERG